MLYWLNTVKDICNNSSYKIFKKIASKIDTCNSLRQKIEKELSENPPAFIHKGNVIKRGSF